MRLDEPCHHFGKCARRAGTDQDADQAAHETADEDDPGNVIVRHDANRGFGEAADELLAVNDDEADDGAGNQRLDRPMRDDREDENDKCRY